MRTEIYYPEEGTLAITRMHDIWHDMEFAMLLNPETGKIIDIAGKIVRGPHSVCPQTEEVLKRLIGLETHKPQLLKRVKEAIPRKDGCVHFYEIVEATLRATACAPPHTSKRVDHDKWEKIEFTDEEDRHWNMMGDWLSNSCKSYDLSTADPAIFEQANNKVMKAGLEPRPIPKIPAATDEKAN